jgi:hypothetical protein
MYVAARNDLDEKQSRVLLSACNLAWRRVTEAVVLTPMQQAYAHSIAHSIMYAHLLRLVQRGERKEQRLASRGVFLICGILACPDHEYVLGRSLRLGGAEIIF